ncbi:MAG TPA: FimV/HubP family polar landmark protein [Burkholderiales bacterium]|nr:FimV/HubP family polar landmark protein [Burkholderiales bacterium]
MPCIAHAVGLGRLTVHSSLGQALDAEVELLGVQKGELDTLAAKLASAEAFRKANVEFNPALPAIKFSIEKRPDGRPYLKLKTLHPVNEPFLDFLIELNWASGRLVKEYTALLDPPGYEPRPTLAPAAPPAPVALPEAQPLPEEAPKPEVAGVPPDEKVGAEAQAAPEEGETAAPQEAAVVPETPAPQAEAVEEKKTYGPIKRGETLRKIAESVKPVDYSLEQMLVGLFRSNHEAFMGNNMNRMKTGPILRVPENTELSTIDPNDAVKEVRVQARNWNAYRQKLAEAVGQATPAATAKQSASGEISTKIEEKAAPKEPGKEVLKLSKGEAGTGGKPAAGDKALQERLRSLEEEIIAREKAVKEANERITMLEKNIRDMQKLLELKNQNLAEVQKQAGAAKPQAAQPAPQPQPAPKPAETKPAEKPAQPQLAARPAAKPEQKPAQVAQQSPPQDKPKPKIITPPPEVSFLDDILDNPLYLGGGAGLIIALLGLGYIAVRKKKSITRFEDSAISSDLKTSTVFGNTEGGTVNTGDSSIMSDFAGKIGGTINTDDVDPLAEAEVYIAYGRDTQAEEILKEALKKDPTRQQIHLKLLEILANHKNVSAFESIASDLYAACGGKGLLWDKAVYLGYKIDPNNPMYASAKGAAVEMREETAAPPGPPHMDFNVGVPSTGEPVEVQPDIAIDTVAPAAPDNVDISFEIPTSETAKTIPDIPFGIAQPADDETDFNLGSIGAETPLAAEPLKPSQEAEPMPEMISYNFGPSKPAEAPAPAPATSEADAVHIDFSSISLNLDEPAAAPAAVPGAAEEAAKDQHWYDVQTKYDLAKAYFEMGDKEGAREILQEVAQEGDAKQQEAAKGLLAQL